MWSQWCSPYRSTAYFLQTVEQLVQLAVAWIAAVLVFQVGRVL